MKSMSLLPAALRHCYGRSEIENRIKEGKNTLRWDKAICHRFAANQARLLAGSLAYNLLHMIRDTAFRGQSVRPSIDSIIRRLVKVGAKVVYHTSRSGGYLHVASAFSNLNAPRGVEFSPERHRIHWSGGSSASTAGNECVLKMQKPVSLTYHLNVRSGNRMVLRPSGSCQKFFRA